jgi:hypothetical protein
MHIRVASAAVIAIIVTVGIAGQQPAPPPARGENPPQSLAMGASKSRMTFFVTSKGLGKNADLTDLERADAHCQALAKAEGAGDQTWRAYLSAAAGRRTAANAIDRIGKGPWYNAEAELVAANREEVRSGKRMTKDTVLTERGDPVDTSTMKSAGQFSCFGID